MKMSFAMLTTLVMMALITGEMALQVEDLTHNLGPIALRWPIGPPYIFTILYRNFTPAGFWFELNKIETVEHIGTHLDAPAHFVQGKFRTHEIPMGKLIGPGVIINVKSKASENPDYQVNVDDLNTWESEHKTIPNGSVVIMNSGWSSKYPNISLTFGTQTPDDVSTFHFPGWHKDAVKWLIKERGVNVVGVDTPSTDYGQSVTIPVHQILGEAQVPGVEFAANLDSIPECGSTIYVGVIKIYEGSGGPVRMFATFEDGDDQNSEETEN